MSQNKELFTVSLKCFALANALILLFSASIFGQTILDPTFDGDGKVTVTVGNYALKSKARDSILQPDGKIVVVGMANRLPDFPEAVEIAVARFNTDGSLDMTFEGDGKVITPIVGVANAVALQSDGKIVVAGLAGSESSENRDAIVLRYNPNGSLDTTFDGDGYRTFNFDVNNAYDVATDVAVQPDSKIVFADGTFAAGFQGFVVSRLNSDGSFDTGFGTNGFTRTNFTNSNPKPKLILQPDGKIIFTGSVPPVGPTLVRYNANGTLDNSFGSNGIISGAGGNNIKLLSNGKFLTVNNVSQANAIVRRYNSDGTLDTTFGSNGATTITFTDSRPDINPPYDLTVQTDGKIIVGGTITLNNGDVGDFAVARLNADGLFDNSFGFNGRFVINIQGRDVGYSVLSQPDGKIILTGESAGGFTLVRLNPGPLNNSCRPVSDFNGDGLTDIGVYQNNGQSNDNGVWRVSLSPMSLVLTSQWGLFTDKIVPADYDGNCRTDLAIFRDGVWAIDYRNGTIGSRVYYSFGQSDDTPIPADYDGDDLADVAVFRGGNWYILGSRDGFFAVQFGLATDKPIPGDYDGDNKEDVAVYRDGTWYLQQSTAGFRAVQWGAAGDKPVVGDYDGDGKSDIAVFRPSNSTWYALRSTQGFLGVQWGISTDVPVPADYDGDGKTDLAVYRSGTWYLLRSTQGFSSAQFGSGNDVPIPSAYVQ